MAHPVMRIRPRELAVMAALLVLWLALMPLVRAASGVDAVCQGRVYGKGRFAEILVCSLQGGWRGWLFIGYLASFPALSLVWFSRLFRHMMKGRGD